MLKKFFISMLGTMAGIWISTALVILGGLMLVGSLIGNASIESEIKVDKHSILYLPLSGEVIEREQNQTLLQFLESYDEETLSLESILLSLRAAAEDDRIEGLYIDCSGAYVGPASRQELIQEINNFKLSGKWVVAYSDSYSQGDYLVATTADSLFLNPMGSVDIHGMGASTMFFKGLLEKLDIKMQILKVGTFKSAVEPFMLSEMSEPARLQLQQYIDSIWNNMSETMAVNRNIPVDSIRRWAAKPISQDPAKTYVEKGLVTSLKYRRQTEAYLRELTGIKDDEELRLVSPADYMAVCKDFDYSSDDSHVAVYYAFGDIVDAGDEGIIGNTVVKDIVALADNENVEGLVMRVNSPGGSAFASEQIWEALEYFKSKGKPYYVSMGDYAASGGYYISCGADSIFADSNTITGSIGVFGIIPDLSGLMTNKFGITFSTVETNPNALPINLFQPMTPAQKDAMQKSVEDIYDLFTSRVAAGRHMSQDSVKAIAEGRVWIASRALQLGLVDRIGSLDQAVAHMLADLDMDNDQVVRYPSNTEEMWMVFLRQAGMQGMKVGQNMDPETVEAIRTVKKLREMNPMQARMATFRIQ